MYVALSATTMTPVSPGSGFGRLCHRRERVPIVAHRPSGHGLAVLGHLDVQPTGPADGARSVWPRPARAPRGGRAGLRRDRPGPRTRSPPGPGTERVPADGRAGPGPDRSRRRRANPPAAGASRSGRALSSRSAREGAPGDRRRRATRGTPDRWRPGTPGTAAAGRPGGPGGRSGAGTSGSSARWLTSGVSVRPGWNSGTSRPAGSNVQPAGVDPTGLPALDRVRGQPPQVHADVGRLYRPRPMSMCRTSPVRAVRSNAVPTLGQLVGVPQVGRGGGLRAGRGPGAGWCRAAGSTRPPGPATGDVPGHLLEHAGRALPAPVPDRVRHQRAQPQRRPPDRAQALDAEQVTDVRQRPTRRRSR